jgi:hypothetical protein
MKNLYAMKHGRTYTGAREEARETEKACRCGWSDGAPIAAKRPAGSEEEEEEEGE